MTFLRRLFGQMPPVIDMRNTTEDWQPGDLARCIGGGWSYPEPFDPRAGEVLRVSRVWEGLDRRQRVLCIGLSFYGKPANAGWECNQFVKVRRAREFKGMAVFKSLLTHPVRAPEKVRAG